MKTRKHDGAARRTPKVTLHRETLRQLEAGELQQAAGQLLTKTCGCTGGTGVTCSGWPPCTC